MKKLVLLLMACTATTVFGQASFETSAGGDQVYGAYGLETAYAWHNLSGWTGVGYTNNGMQAGGYLKVPLHKSESNEYHLNLGDQALSSFLDTDEFESHNFSVRGGGIAHNTKTMHVQMFSGVLLEESMLPFMHTGDMIGTPLTAMTMSRQLSKTLQLHALNLYDGKVTSIGSIGWNPNKSWRLAGAGGIGAGAGYAAGAAEYAQKKMDLRGSYTLAATGFQRQEQPYYSNELLGLNGRASFTPIDAFNLNVYHEKSITSIVGFPSVTGKVDAANLSVILKGFQLSPSVSNTVIQGIPGNTLAESFSATKRIMSGWRAFGSYINIDSSQFKQQTEVAVNEFKVCSRLMVLQNFSRMNGQDTYSFGGEWVSNLISVSIDQQVYMSPIAVAFGSKPIFQAWTVNLRVRTPHGSNAHLDSIVSPTGKVQWGGYLGGLRYTSVGPEHDDSPTFSKYAIRGVVVDQSGEGVGGIAVQVGHVTVISNDSGVFYLDVKNTKPIAVKVLEELSVQPLRWRLKTAPESAKGTLEGAAPIRVVVEMGASMHTSRLN